MRKILCVVLVLLLLCGFVPTTLDLVKPGVVEAAPTGAHSLPVEPNVPLRSGGMIGVGGNYTTVHNQSDADSLSSVNHYVGQSYASPTYNVFRDCMTFDTSVLPDDAVVTELTLTVYVGTDYSDQDFTITVVSGEDIDTPFVDADYGDLLDEVTSYGTLSTVGGLSGQKTITLSSDAYSWVDPMGHTSLALRSDRDISSTTPTQKEYVYLANCGQWEQYAWLNVTYTTGSGTVTVYADFENAYDFYVHRSGSDYTAVHNAASGTGIFDDTNNVRVGQSLIATNYYIYRAGLFFDTSCIPDTATVTAARLLLRRDTTGPAITVDFDVTIVDGASLDKPPNYADYGDLGNETESWGYLNTSEIATSASILYAGPLTNISRTGWTQFGLRSSREITSQVPTGVDEQIYFFTVDSATQSYGYDHVPRLEVTYSIFSGGVVTNAETNVTSTSATLNGVMTNDDDESTVYGYFEWGLTQSFGNSTTQLVITEGVAFSGYITTLTRYTPYYFRVVATVPGKGAVYGIVRRFVTLAERPVVETFGAASVTTVSAVLHGYLSGDGGASCEWRFRWGISVGAYWWETAWTGDISDDTTFDYNLYGLAPGVTYFYIAQCQNVSLTGSGNEVQFATDLSNPTVITRPATTVSVTTAILNAYLTDDGGEDCYIRFQYGKTAGYGTDTSWGYPYSEGQGAYRQLYELDANTTYHFRAQAYNSNNGVGSPVSGADATLTTYAGCGTVTNFNVVVNSGTEVSINWTPSSGSQKTMIRHKLGSYPSSISDGNLAYFATGTGTTLGSLTPGVTYYFSAWGHAPDDYWSSVAATDAATTSAVGAAATLLPTPSMPSTWFLNPSITKIQGMPGFAIVQWQSDMLGVPVGSWCMILAVMVAAFTAGLLLVFTRSSTMALVGAAVVCFAGAMAGLVPLWIMFTVIVIGTSVIYIVPAGRAM